MNETYSFQRLRKEKKMEQRKFNLYNKSLGKAGGSMVTPKHKITSVEKEM